MGIMRLTGQLICTSAAQMRQVVTHLQDHVTLTRAEPGCLHFDVSPTPDPLIWQVDEAFADHEAFAAHQSRTAASVWASATSDIRREFRQTEDTPA